MNADRVYDIVARLPIIGFYIYVSTDINRNV